MLARDWGSDIWTTCNRCNALHPPLPPPSKHKKTALTTYCFGQDACVDYLPKNDEGKGYSLVLQHIVSAFEQPPPKQGTAGPRIPSLSGDFAIEYPKFTYRLVSSAQRGPDNNLILKHVHTLHPSKNSKLCAADILPLPLRLCPHQSTAATGPKEKSLYFSRKCIEKNSPQLTHAITSAFPSSLRTDPDPSIFAKSTATELRNIEATDSGVEVVWRCRSCPTKYRVEYVVEKGRGRLVIKTWHCFGKDVLHAQKYFKWMVRREGKLLGKDKRNDEWWSPSRSVPDFGIE
jgi:hypothetical protein